MIIPKNEREYRDLILTVANTEEPEDRHVRGYASTFNEPYLLFEDADAQVWEQVDPAAFESTDMSDVIMQYDHEGRVFARVSNGTLTVAPDDHGLLIDADLGGTTIGRELYEEIRGGYTSKMSFGFTVPDDGSSWTNEPLEDGRRKVLRTITRVGKLYDVSAVSLPANPNTAISVRTKEICDGVIAEIAEECRRAEAEEHREKQREELARLLKEVKRND